MRLTRLATASKIKNKYIRRFTKVGIAFELGEYDQALKLITTPLKKKDFSRYERTFLTNYEGNIYFEQAKNSRALEKLKQLALSSEGFYVQ